jgi:hypothetical protein
MVTGLINQVENVKNAIANAKHVENRQEIALAAKIIFILLKTQKNVY